MKFIAAVDIDFERGPLGTRSRLNESIEGETVLRRTLQRLTTARGLESVHLVAAKSQEAQARQAVEGLPVRVETHDAPAVPWRAFVASARKWALDAWRGGLAGMTVFDEGFNPWVLSALARKESADALVLAPGASPLIDPAMLEAMLAHFEKVCNDVRMVFTQTAPGLAATIYSLGLLDDLASVSQPPGKAMSYMPSEPKRDMVMQSCYFSPEGVIAQATGRCIADTGEALSRVEAILRDQAHSGAIDVRAVSVWLGEHKLQPAALPEEVEIELTTQDPLSNSTLRPRGESLRRTGCMDKSLFDRLIEELAARDDARVVLGGFGDPLQHPQFVECVAACRRAGIFGVTVRTPAITLDLPAIDALIEADIDVLNVLLDANSPQTYRDLHGADYFDRVVANVEQFLARRQEAGRATPLLVCEMMKTRDTMAEMEAFYDRWVGRTGAAVLAGPSAYSGRWPDQAVVRMAPPARFPCQRVFKRVLVLADGRVAPCDQDFRGEHAIGTLAESRLTDLWCGAAMAGVRRQQVACSFDSLPICALCEEWHRP